MMAWVGFETRVVASHYLPRRSEPSEALIPRASALTRVVPRSGGLVLRARFGRRYGDISPVQHRKIRGDNPARFACTRRKTSAYGQLLARWTHTFRVVTRTQAPIFNSFNRIV
jgi:hypothetical protein